MKLGVLREASTSTSPHAENPYLVAELFVKAFSLSDKPKRGCAGYLLHSKSRVPQDLHDAHWDRDITLHQN